MVSGSLPDKNQEYFLLAFFLIPTAYMLIQSYNFPPRVGLFPQLSALGVIVFSLLVVLEKYIPDYLIPENNEHDDTNFTAESKNTSEERPDGFDSESARGEKSNKSLKDGLNLSVWIIAYLFSSYLFGFLWTTPISVLVYSYIKDMSIVESLILTIISVTIAYLFMTVTRVPIDEGMLTAYIIGN